MKYSEFIGEAQDMMDMPTQAKAVRACRAVLTTLGERLYPGEAEDLAGSLPMELDHFVRDAKPGQRFSRDEFLQRVAEIEDSDEADALWHIQVVFGLLSRAISPGEMEDIRSGLPEGFDDFFAKVEAGIEA